MIKGSIPVRGFAPSLPSDAYYIPRKWLRPKRIRKILDQIISNVK